MTGRLFRYLKSAAVLFAVRPSVQRCAFSCSGLRFPVVFLQTFVEISENRIFYHNKETKPCQQKLGGAKKSRKLVVCGSRQLCGAALCFCTDAVVFREKMRRTIMRLCVVSPLLRTAPFPELVCPKTRRYPLESGFVGYIAYSSSQRSRIRRSVFSMPRHGSVMDCP